MIHTVNRSCVVTMALLLGSQIQPAHGQDVPRTVVRVRVVDSSGIALGAAGVVVMRGLHEVMAEGLTDSAGRRVLAFAVDTGDFQLIARKIGFERGDRFFRIRKWDTLSFDIRLTRLAQTLEAVRSTARASNSVNSYYIDADEIASSTRSIIDGWDVLRKLRPDMLGDFGRMCGEVKHVWVNGRRVSLGVRPALILKDIAAEHIAEIRYVNCWNTSMPGVAGQDAVYVVLKPGVGYRWPRGTYVIEPEPRVAKSPR
jgi:hypothetical protein